MAECIDLLAIPEGEQIPAMGGSLWPRMTGSVEDPRLERRRVHALEKTLVIPSFAIAGGVSSWRQIEEFGKHLDLSTGI